jgi:hypothetical protein
MSTVDGYFVSEDATPTKKSPLTESQTADVRETLRETVEKA